MLKTLTVKNIALIDNALIDFSDGLNVLTGETGAGKSLIINSLGILKGNRMSKELIRTGETGAQVTGLFEINDNIREKIYDITGIECEDELLISRQITTDGKNNIRINGVPVILNMLKAVGDLLINIHSQHDGTVLLNKSSHLDFLDDFCGTEIQIINDYKEAYFRLKGIEEALSSIECDQAERERKIDILKYQADEIEAAALKENEEDELNERKHLISNSKKIVESCYGAYTLLYESSSDAPSAYDSLSSAIKLIENVSEYDKGISDALTELSDAMYSVSENARILKDFSDNLSYDERELDQIEERLELIYTLKKKYGSTICEIFEYYDKISMELSDVVNSDERREQLLKEKEVCFSNAKKLSEKLSDIRQKYALVLSEKIMQELSDLEMPQVEFKVDFKMKDFGESGADDVEFLICTNVGEGLKPLSKIASGGEMSRIILAIKNVLSKEKTAETLIFDEVDTGVSGKVAQRIGEKLYSMGRFSQVLSITHLPQMAAFNDEHFVIKKLVDNKRTVTEICKLSADESVEEIARLLGGETISSVTKENAKELINSAKSIKEKYIK